MKRTPVSVLLPTFIIILVLLVSCAPNVVTPTEIPAATLTIVGTENEKAFTVDELKTLPSTEGQGGIISSTGKITIPDLFKGVAIKDLISNLGASFDPTMGVTIIAEDGYSMTLSYDQVMNGSFIAYDPATGKELPLHDPLTAIIAYEHKGEPLNAKEDGAFRLMVISEKNNQVVDGHWSVKWVSKVEIMAVGETWVLDLTGAIPNDVTRDSFQSCSSPSCHGKTYQDANGQTWQGVPLWLLVGSVDDADSHSDYAYNEDLAATGYTIEIVTEDGNTIYFTSDTISKDNQVLLANLVNEGELPDLYYPLRLVGSSVKEDQMYGKITEVHVDLPPLEVLSTEVPANDGKIAITGMVNEELTVLDAELRKMELLTISAEGKEGPEEFTGVPLNLLLDKSGIQEGATKLVLTASDDYAAEINLVDVRASANALLAFMETPGEYLVVFPDQPTSTWVKYVVSIEVK